MRYAQWFQAPLPPYENERFSVMRIEKFPWGCVIVLLVIAAFNLEIIAHAGHTSEWDELLSNTYAETLHGEIWQPCTSWLPHLNREHLLWDIAFLAVVGALVEGTQHPLSSWTCVKLGKSRPFSRRIIAAPGLYDTEFPCVWFPPEKASTSTEGISLRWGEQTFG